jgi:predicted nucleic acid-binding protein
VLDWTRPRSGITRRSGLIEEKGIDDQVERALLIASHARSMDATVVTHNAKDFSRVKGLKFENWLD